MKKKIYNIIGIAIIFGCGVTLGKLFNWGYFELTKEISIIDALSLFVTAGLAIYITKILEKEVQESRIEKDLYIAKISEIEMYLRKIEESIQEKDFLFSKITNQIHSCRVIKTSLFQCIIESFEKNKVEFENVERNLSSNLKSLSKLLTETPIIQQMDTEIILKKGLVTYSQNRILEIITELNSLNDTLFKLKVNINSL